MKIGIVGSRTFEDYSLFCKVMNDLNCDTIISGGARGADSLAKRYAKEKEINYVEYPAEWDKYGKSAGYKRNKLIVNDSDKLVAFWDRISKGTKHSIDLAKLKGIEVIIIDNW